MQLQYPSLLFFALNFVWYSWTFFFVCFFFLLFFFARSAIDTSLLLNRKYRKTATTKSITEIRAFPFSSQLMQRNHFLTNHYTIRIANDLDWKRKTWAKNCIILWKLEYTFFLNNIDQFLFFLLLLLLGHYFNSYWHIFANLANFTLAFK